MCVITIHTTYYIKYILISRYILSVCVYIIDNLVIYSEKNTI